MRQLAIGLVLSLALAACASPAPSGGTTAPPDSSAPGPSGGISADSAVALARTHVTMTTLVDVSAGTFATLLGSPGRDHGVGAPIGAASPDRWVWAVTFSGDIAICNPLGSCLSPRPATGTVYLDYFTGDFLESSTMSPAR
jgi:hypothetical protein